MEKTKMDSKEKIEGDLSRCFALGDRGLQGMVKANLFSLGCYLLHRGEELAGLKVLRMALDSLHVSTAKVEKIVKYALKDPKKAGLMANPSNELLNLLKWM